MSEEHHGQTRNSQGSKVGAEARPESMSDDIERDADTETSNEKDKAKDEDEDDEVCLEDISREDAQESDDEAPGKPPGVRTRAKSFYSRHFVDSWGREFMSWGFSLLVVLCIILILYFYDNRPQSDWSAAISLTSTISLLNTIAKLGFASTTTSALGQLRWNWYDDPRPLGDWAAFESASRGQTFGSLDLLRKLHVRHLASVGAFISLSSIFFSSLTLQAITVPSRQTVIAGASIPRTYKYTSPYNQTFRLATLSQNYISATDNSVLAAIAFTAYNGSQVVDPSINLNAECTTGDCRFDVFATLAACSECFMADTDISQFSRDSEQYYTLPLGINASVGPLITGSRYDDVNGDPIYTHVNITANILANRPVNVFNLTAMYTNYTMTGNISSPYEPIATRAMRCGVFMCVKTINSTVSNGTLIETVKGTHIIDVTSPGAGDNGVYNFPLNATALNATSNDTQTGITQLTINQDSLNVLGQSLANLYTGSSIIAPGLVSPNTNFSYGYGYTSTVMQGLSSSGTVNIAQSVENIATVMTNMIRSQGNTSDYVSGLAYSTVSYYHIDWVWIIYPAGLELIVLLFLLATIWKTRRSSTQNVWKSNPIALLFHGLEARGKALEKVAETEKLSEMSKMAGKIKVRLDRKGPSTNLVDASAKKNA